MSSLERVYSPDECVTFRKTSEAFGGLSNMAPGYRVRVGGILFLTVEALYQACRYPHIPELQDFIISQRSPMTMKMHIKKHISESRPDWGTVRVKIMRWCIRVKLAQNLRSFGTLLLQTENKYIVEDSRKDAFWGAMRTSSGHLVGANILGRLLMELREEHKSTAHGQKFSVDLPEIPALLLLGKEIHASSSSDEHEKSLSAFSNQADTDVSFTLDRIRVTQNLVSTLNKLLNSVAALESDFEARVELQANGCSADTLRQMQSLISGMGLHSKIKIRENNVPLSSFSLNQPPKV